MTVYRTILLLLVLSLPGVAQAEKTKLPKACKGINVGIDKFTKQPAMNAQASVPLPPFVLPKSWNLGFTMRTSGAQPILAFKSSLSGALNTSLKPGWSMMLLLADDTVVNLVLEQPSSPQLQATSSGGILSIYAAEGALERESLRALAKSEVVAYRANYGDGDRDFKFEAGGQLQRAAACAAGLQDKFWPEENASPGEPQSTEEPESDEASSTAGDSDKI